MRDAVVGLMRSRRVRIAAVLLAVAGALAGVLAGAAPAGSPPKGALRAVSAAAADRRSSGRSGRSRPAVAALRAFASCAALVRYGRRYLALTNGVPESPVEPLAGSVPAAPPGAPAGVSAPSSPAPVAAAPGTPTSSAGGYSTTTDQESGVDEPDTVKSDGTTVFAVAQNQLEAVDVSSGAPRLIGSLDLGRTGYGAQLLLSGSRLLVVSGQGPVPLLDPGGVAVAAPSAGSRPASGVAVPRPGRPPVARVPALPSPYYLGGSTVLSEVDVSDPAAMRTLRTATIDGAFVDARENGATARIVISSAPRAIIEPALRARAGGYIPAWHFHSFVTGRRYSAPVAGCRQIARPAQFSGLGMLTILTIDLGAGLWSTTADALMADAQVVYGSQDSLYVASQKWVDPTLPLARVPALQTTQIDRFDVTNPDATTLLASGEVLGSLLNQFSLSEANGYLRVASTSVPEWWGGTVPQVPSQSYITVLATSGNQLVPVGKLSGLGTGERIYSVRFVGDTGYVVAFRQVDPLYTINLSVPTAPRVSGQLELAGYSSYLQPLEDGLLLGIGQVVGSDNEPAGTQLELFDVSVPGQPKLLQRMTLGQYSSSEAQFDHHAFLFWPATSLAVLPLEIYQPASVAPTAPGAPTSGSTTSAAPSQPFVGAIGLHIDPSGITKVGSISAPAINGYTPPITRAIVVGNELYTISDAGIAAASLDTLAQTGFAPFPALTHPVPPGLVVP